ncbi:selenide, water dikinase SelD [Aliisedimentitalea scapharcae]|uniref:Selenide, water dikinase SelD n=1 Tax=Aliisedimentitalea scapharcae TaxID=1524259 RepID=A0ABZ2XPF0_9RHOB
MDMPRLPATRDLVLIGGGHAHALVLRKWGMNPLPGARVTVINPGATAPYSGMLPGFVAGHYDRWELDIDLVKLARFAGARVVLGAATGLDLEARVVHVPGRPPIGFDVASVDIGITSDMPALPGFADHAIPAKPLGPFAARWDHYRAGDTPAHVAVIGGGVAGVELILAMAHALKQRRRLAQAHLIDNAQALMAIGTKARARLIQALSEQGVTLHENVEIAGIEADGIRLADTRLIRSDFTTGAAGARPYDWVSETGLALENGFISVDAQLRSSDPAVFATGDCAHLTASPRPKAGVYAVRQAPILYHNLCATMSGHSLRPYRAQKDYLKLISMGDKQALAERFAATWSGPLMWTWKNRIDQSFMQKFRDLPKMEQPELPQPHAQDMQAALGDKPMCGGCGAKIGQPALRAALAPMASTSRSDIEMLPGDDAALLRIGSARQVISTDHLRTLTPDPVMMTRIAANHALGDIWAMGATPQAALASVILPRLSPALQERTLSEIMTTATETMREAGAEIVGGHSSVGDEMTLGFTVTGLCARDPITLAGAQAGDALILTKPIGSGTLMAAEMAGIAHGDDIAAALDLMMMPQGQAAQVLATAHAMTDVTGFGLAGHLMGICDASQVAARLDLSTIPLMKGAASLAKQGVRSSLFPENRAVLPNLPQGNVADLLFDPQTAGGLLAAVAPDQATQLCEALRASGYPAAIIGEMINGPIGISLS